MISHQFSLKLSHGGECKYEMEKVSPVGQISAILPVTWAPTPPHAKEVIARDSSRIG